MDLHQPCSNSDFSDYCYSSCVVLINNEVYFTYDIVCDIAFWDVDSGLDYYYDVSMVYEMEVKNIIKDYFYNNLFILFKVDKK